MRRLLALFFGLLATPVHAVGPLDAVQRDINTLKQALASLTATTFQVVAKTASAKATTNSSAEQFLGTFALPSPVPAGRVIRLHAEGMWNANDAADTFTWRVYFGPTGAETKVCDSSTIQATSAGNLGTWGVYAEITLQGLPSASTPVTVLCREVMTDGASPPGEARTRGQVVSVTTLNLATTPHRIKFSVQDGPGSNSAQGASALQTQVSINDGTSNVVVP